MMLPVIYFPIVYATAWAMVAYQVSKHIKSAVPVSTGAARERLSCLLAGALTEMPPTIMALLAAAYWANRIFDRHDTPLLVWSIYAGSILL